MLLFSLGLADRLNVLNQEKARVQQQALETQTRLRESFERFVPKELLRHLNLADIVDVKLGDLVQLEMSMMFTDIRSFTDRSEKMSPRQTFELINDYLRDVGPVVREHRGFIDKFIGDAIMALFPARPDDAIDAAVGIFLALQTVNARLQSRGLDPIHMGHRHPHRRVDARHSRRGAAARGNGHLRRREPRLARRGAQQLLPRERRRH